MTSENMNLLRTLAMKYPIVRYTESAILTGADEVGSLIRCIAAVCQTNDELQARLLTVLQEKTGAEHGQRP